MHSSVARAIDRLISRGAGLDERGDPFAPAPSPEQARAWLDAIRRASPAQDAPFDAPLAPPDGGARVGVRRFGEGARWALVAPHYGSLAHPARLGTTSSLVTALRREGFAVAVLELPYHGSRAMKGLPSGWGFVRADLAATAHAVCSAAADVMALARRLRDVEGATHLVGAGVSLGSQPLGLAAALGAPFDALAFLAGVDNPVAFYATGENRDARRRTLAKHGHGMAEVEKAFEPFSPSTYASPLAGRRVAFAIPPEDGVVPALTQERWRARWDGERLALPGHGHATALASPWVGRRVARQLARS